MSEKKQSGVLFHCLHHGQWPLLLISPALSFISSINMIRRGEIRACWAIPIIMGLIAYLFPPFADFARVESRIIEMLDLPLSSVIALNGDVIVTSFEYFFLKNSIPIELFRFIYTFAVYYSLTSIYVDINKTYSLSAKQSFCVWAFLFFLIEFFGFIDNIRTIFIRVMLFFCMYHFYFKKEEKYRYYSLLLLPVHFAYFPIILLFFFSKYLITNVSRTVRVLVTVLLLIGGLGVSFIDLSSVLSILNLGDTLNQRMLAYTEGEWSSGGESLNNQSLAYKIYIALLSIKWYYLMFVYCKARYRSSFDIFTVFVGALCLFTISIPVLFGRYAGFYNMAMALFVILGYLNGHIRQKEMNTYLLLSLFNVFLDLYSNWNCLVNGNIYFLFLPLPLALFQTYDFVEWRNAHLSEDFNKIINGGFLSR